MATSKPIPNISEIFNADGTLNADAAAAGFAIASAEAANFDITDGKAHQSDGGKSDKPGRTKKIRVTISFTRHE